jgi:hypothetical protein
VPFEDQNAVTVALKHVNERPVPPSSFNASVTPALESIVMRALEKAPESRFPDADAFIGALERANGTVATAEPPAELPTRIQRHGRRRRGWPPVPLLDPAADALGRLGATATLRGAPDLLRDGRREARRSSVGRVHRRAGVGGSRESLGRPMSPSSGDGRSQRSGAPVIGTRTNPLS